MVRLRLVVVTVFATVLAAQAQYKGTYVGWSSGYIFTGSLSQVVWKCYTHLFNFQVTVNSSGALGTGNLAVGHSQFVAACKQNGLKSILCIGGAGQSKNFSAAVANPATQTKLVSNILNMVRSGGYDGVDLDWECGEENDGAAMVAKFKAFHKEIRDSLNRMNPRPMFTAAVATDWYPNSSAAIAEYLDQMNNMSYYNYVKDMDRIFKPVLDKGVSKKLMGVGFGFDTDNEVTDINDIAAKCRYSIDNGYGGIMTWDITHAPKVTSDTIAKYVSLQHTSGIARGGRQAFRSGRIGGLPALMISVDKGTGRRTIAYDVPAAQAGAALVDIGIYSPDGAKVRTLIRGFQKSGPQAAEWMRDDGTGRAVAPGNYVVRLTLDGKDQAAQTVAVR